MTARWKRWLKALLLVALLAVLAAVIVVESGLAEKWARAAIVSRIESMTGGRAEIERFRFHPLTLRAELVGLTVRGTEPEGTLPFFHADYLLVDVHLVSLFRPQAAIEEVHLHRPVVHVRVDAEGRSNVPRPVPPRPAGVPIQRRIFDLAIGSLRITDGFILFNDVRTPLVAEGGDFQFRFDFHAPVLGQEYFTGEVRWHRMTMVARRYMPFASDMDAKFLLRRNHFELAEMNWRLPHSVLRFEATVENFAEPVIAAKYSGELGLQDLRDILRKPNSPLGRVELAGTVGRAAGRTSLDGRYHARDISLHYEWFHTAGIESWGRYTLLDDPRSRRILVPDFEARAVGGQIQGRVEFFFEGQRFHVDSRARGMSLARILAAVDNEHMPTAALGWHGSVDVDSVTTWLRDFKSVDSRGRSFWSPPLEPAEGQIPATARFDYHYVMDAQAVELRSSEISTPASRITFDGRLGTRGTALAVDFRTEDIAQWNDFIYRLRDPGVERVPITGQVSWQGRVTGRLDHPTFAGRARATQAAYGDLLWDEFEGDITYWPEGFRIERATARRGRASATLEMWLELDRWNFRPEHPWGAEASLVRAPLEGLQALFGTRYPVEGQLTGQFRLRGTKGDPELTGLVDVAEVVAWGTPLERARGQIALRSDEWRVANAELRLGTGRVTGNFLYRTDAQEIEFDAAGAVVPLERIPAIQTARLPLGGQLSFQLAGRGPLAAPRTEGSIRIVDLRVGREVLGSIQGDLRSDGRRIELALDSAMAAGSFRGRLEVTLEGDYPMRGDFTVQNMDLDPFIETAFRLRALTGHSRADGRFLLEGQLARPETISVNADVSRLEFDYQYLKFRNDGPLRVIYSRDEVRILQARIRGPDTDFTISGFARFTGDRALNLRMDGSVDLRLAGGFLPELEAQGVARVNGSAAGTLSNPRITGRISVEDASARYGEIPVGLSNLTGEFIFDQSRMLFSGVTAEAGGGQLLLDGSLTYGDGPLRFDVSTRATRVRIRYPEGMSWLAGGNLRLSGSTEGGLLAGRVTVERLLMAEGFDLTSLIGVAGQQPVAGPRTGSQFLRNLRFDIEATSTPDARMQWTGAQLESEASLRVRGTWEHPILLGHIHLLSGEITFRGNRYRLTRGDINFASPFRILPVLDVEATTTIRQYEVTLNFTGEADKLRLAYRSDPPLPAGDIIALLALGRTGEESELRRATTETAPELGAGALLSEAISAQVGGRIERLFGITRFKVDPFLAGTGAEQNATARITIEQQITRDLVITYVTNVTSTQQQVIQIEYNVSRNISVVGLRDQNGTFGLDFKIRKRFD